MTVADKGIHSINVDTLKYSPDINSLLQQIHQKKESEPNHKNKQITCNSKKYKQRHNKLKFNIFKLRS